MAKAIKNEGQDQTSDVAERADNVSRTGITVNDVTPAIRQTPNVFILPPDASKAQVRLARIFNGFAVQFPDKFEVRKQELIDLLDAAKDAPDPVEDPDRHVSVGPKAPVNVI